MGIFVRVLSTSKYATERSLLLCLAIIVVLTRLPFVSSNLFYWDSVHFALALENFDVVKHQPQPPGYILFVALGNLVNLLVGDPNRSFIAISVGGAALGTVAMYRLGKEVFGVRAGWTAALLFAFSPMLWFYSEIGALYSIEPALVAVVLLFCWRARLGQRRMIYISALTLGLIGGVRQTTLAFLIPVWLYSAWPRSEGEGRSSNFRLASFLPLVSGGLLLTATVAFWFVPLVYVSGGLQEYWLALTRLSKLDALSTSVLYRGPSVIPDNAVRLLAGLFNGLEAASLLFILWLFRLFPYRAEPTISLSNVQSSGSRGPANPSPKGLDPWFVALSLLPVTLFLLLIHLGELGYAGILLPILFLYVPGLIHSFVADLGVRIAKEKPFGLDRFNERLAADLTLVVLLLLYIAGFLWGPFHMSRRGLIEKNHRWSETDRLVRQFDPKDTVLLTNLYDLDTFRHLFYYQPEYHVYMVDTTTGRAEGWFFEGYRHESNYGFREIPQLRDTIVAGESGFAHVLMMNDDLASGTQGWQERDRWTLPEKRTVYHFVPSGAEKTKAISITAGVMRPATGD